MPAHLHDRLFYRDPTGDDWDETIYGDGYRATNHPPTRGLHKATMEEFVRERLIGKYGGAFAMGPGEKLVVSEWQDPTTGEMKYNIGVMDGPNHRKLMGTEDATAEVKRLQMDYHVYKGSGQDKFDADAALAFAGRIRD